jgi:hypothetical protein
VELQNYERTQHTTRLAGAQVADLYLDWVLKRAEAPGAVLLAESSGIFLGFVAGWIKETDNIGETLDSNRVGYISDIGRKNVKAVKEEFAFLRQQVSAATKFGSNRINKRRQFIGLGKTSRQCRRWRNICRLKRGRDLVKCHVPTLSNTPI